MNYYEMIKRVPEERLALVEDGVPYTYGELFLLINKEAEKIKASFRDQWRVRGMETAPKLFFIKEERIKEQLVQFFAAQSLNRIPVILPDPDMETEELCKSVSVPETACVGVCTSGSRGVPKIYFRTFESWAGYFPVQNKIFGISGDSRMFAQGSLSFTGNLNLYLAQFSLGASVVAQNDFLPKEWVSMIKEWETNIIYLIPDKLMCLKRAADEEYPFVKNILSGSQSMGKTDALNLKKIFPESRVILYYGASELNYITYLTDEEMTEEKNLVGRAFPETEVTVREGMIYVSTEYHVCGISCPYTLSDTGYFDEKGMLHFTGRRDDIIKIHGKTVSVYKIEEALLRQEGVLEAAVLPDEKEHLLAYVKGTDALSEKLEEEARQQIFSGLKKTLASFEMPRNIFFVEQLPKNASGKTDKKALKT